MAGIDFFSTGKETIIKVVNLNDVDLNKETYAQLLGVTLLAKPIAQFWFEYVGGKKSPGGVALDGKYYYSFTAQQAVTALEKVGRDASGWKKLDPETEATLIASACEIEN